MPEIVQISGHLYGDHGANTAVDSFNQGQDHIRALEDRELQREVISKEVEIAEQRVGAFHRELDLKERAFEVEKASALADQRVAQFGGNLNRNALTDKEFSNGAQELIAQFESAGDFVSANEVRDQATVALTEQREQARIPDLLRSAGRLDGLIAGLATGTEEHQPVITDDLRKALSDPDPKKRSEAVRELGLAVAQADRDYSIAHERESAREQYTADMLAVPLDGDMEHVEDRDELRRLSGAMATADTPAQMRGILREYRFLAVGATEAIKMEKQEKEQMRQERDEARQAFEEVSQVMEQLVARSGSQKMRGGSWPGGVKGKKFTKGSGEEGMASWADTGLGDKDRAKFVQEAFEATKRGEGEQFFIDRNVSPDAEMIEEIKQMVVAEGQGASAQEEYINKELASADWGSARRIAKNTDIPLAEAQKLADAAEDDQARKAWMAMGSPDPAAFEQKQKNKKADRKERRAKARSRAASALSDTPSTDAFGNPLGKLEGLNSEQKLKTRRANEKKEDADKKREFQMTQLMKKGHSRKEARDILIKRGVKFPNKGRDGLDEARAHKPGGGK